jgi:hypothetical protein
MINISSLAIVITALYTLQAAAQQQVPSQLQKLDTSAWKQTIPGINAQGIPGSQQPPAMLPHYELRVDSTKQASGLDECSLSEVSAAELKAVRASIIAALGNNIVGVASFTNAENRIPAPCTRRRAAYYLRAIAQIQSAK